MDNWISNIPYTFQCVIWKLYKFCLQGEYVQYRLLGSDILNIKSYYVNKFNATDEKLCAEYLAFTKDIENIWSVIVKIINEETDKLVPIDRVTLLDKSYTINPVEFTASETHNIDGTEKTNVEIIKVLDESFYSVSENHEITFVDDNAMETDDYNKIHETNKLHLSMVLAAEQSIITNAQPIINEFLRDKLVCYKQKSAELRAFVENTDESVFEQTIFCDDYSLLILDIANISSVGLNNSVYMLDNIELSEEINKCLDIINYTPETFGEEFINKLNSLVKLIDNPTNQHIDDIYTYYNTYNDFHLVFHSLYVPGFRCFPSLNTMLGIFTFVPEDSDFINRQLKYTYKNLIKLNISVVYPLYKNGTFAANNTGYKIANNYILFENIDKIDYNKWLTTVRQVNNINIVPESLDIFKRLYEQRITEYNYNILAIKAQLWLIPVKEIEYINSHWEIDM